MHHLILTTLLGPLLATVASAWVIPLDTKTDTQTFLFAHLAEAISNSQSSGDFQCFQESDKLPHLSSSSCQDLIDQKIPSLIDAKETRPWQYGETFRWVQDSPSEKKAEDQGHCVFSLNSVALHTEGGGSGFAMFKAEEVLTMANKMLKTCGTYGGTVKMAAPNDKFTIKIVNER